MQLNERQIQWQNSGAESGKGGDIRQPEEEKEVSVGGVIEFNRHGSGRNSGRETVFLKKKSAFLEERGDGQSEKFVGSVAHGRVK